MVLWATVVQFWVVTSNNGDKGTRFYNGMCMNKKIWLWNYSQKWFVESSSLTQQRYWFSHHHQLYKWGDVIFYSFLFHTIIPAIFVPISTLANMKRPKWWCKFSVWWGSKSNSQTTWHKCNHGIPSFDFNSNILFRS